MFNRVLKSGRIYMHDSCMDACTEACTYPRTPPPPPPLAAPMHISPMQRHARKEDWSLDEPGCFSSSVHYHFPFMHRASCTIMHHPRLLHDGCSMPCLSPRRPGGLASSAWHIRRPGGGGAPCQPHPQDLKYVDDKIGALPVFVMIKFRL